MGKLYVRMNVPCPFLFRTSHAPPRGSLIRATPIFWNPEHVNEVVKRCPTHIARSPNEPMSQVKHLLTSDHREARHVEDSVTRRLCVVIPHEEPQGWRVDLILSVLQLKRNHFWRARFLRVSTAI